MGRRTIIGRAVRTALLGAFAATIASCSYLPDVAEFKVPTLNLDSFQIHDWNAYARSQTATRPVGPNDYVDGNGYCPNMAPPVTQTSADPSNPTPVAPPAPTGGGVGLDMSECEVVMAAGVPQHVEITNNERGERTVIMTYTTSERAGTYRFVNGRLVSLERGPEPPPTQQAQKKPTKKQAKPKQPPKQQQPTT
jgi:hypothetical protein